MSEHPFNDKSMVITEPAVLSAWLLGLSSNPYPSNMKRMLNKIYSTDSCRVFLKFAEIEQVNERL